MNHCGSQRLIFSAFAVPARSFSLQSWTRPFSRRCSLSRHIHHAFRSLHTFHCSAVQLLYFSIKSVQFSIPLDFNITNSELYWHSHYVTALISINFKQCHGLPFFTTKLDWSSMNILFPSPGSWQLLPGEREVTSIFHEAWNVLQNNRVPAWLRTAIVFCERRILGKYCTVRYCCTTSKSATARVQLVYVEKGTDQPYHQNRVVLWVWWATDNGVY